MNKNSFRAVLIFAPVVCTPFLHAAPSPKEVGDAMKQAANYYSGTVSQRGGYVYYYSDDLSRRLGEGTATATEIWVQPPGTPAVGEAYLVAHRATGDAIYLDASLRAGAALIYGQLQSGGWRNSIDFDPAVPLVDQYRGGRGKGKNFSTLDDDITQSALRFLIQLDVVTEFSNQEIHEAVEYGLSRLLEAQFPNGAFPQGWTGPVGSREVVAASFPEYEWRTEGRIKEYWNEYTLNDGLAGTVARLLISAHEAYKKDEYLAALKKLGEFLLLAQLPEPQAGWAQQYGESMHPIWARAFEPPAVSGRESEDAMLTLLMIAEYTGDKRFATPVVAGVKYLERSLLPDGQLARYYEIGSNVPLYMNRAGDSYSLTHDDSNLPDHYGWKNPARISLIKDAYRAQLAGRALSEVFSTPLVDGEEAERIISELDEKGRWLTRHKEGGPRLVGQPKFKEGENYLSSAVFVQNLNSLSRYLKPGS